VWGSARRLIQFRRRLWKRDQRAAEIQGRPLTDFVVAADEAACRAIEESEIIRLSLKGQQQIATAILNPTAAGACPIQAPSFQFPQSPKPGSQTP
jgi:uncharacterized protein (DUF1778 family)